MPVSMVVPAGGSNPFGSEVDLSEMQQIATARLLGNVSGGNAVPSLLTAAQVVSMLGITDGLAAASQAEMEAASATDKSVTPGRTKYHPGVAKAWAHFNGTGTAALAVSHGISSLTDNGTGDYTLNFATAFSSGDYAVLAGGNYQESGSTSITGGIVTVSARATPRVAGSCRLACSSSGVGTSSLGDFPAVYAAFLGDQ